ncbi:MAG: cytochrome b N-terminal domain-containing protein [Hyphomicrobiales bacterium]
MPKMKETIRHRIGWETHLEPFLYKKLPASLGWSATLGSLCALLFTLMAVSGMFLAMYYSPSPDRAYQSIDYIMTQLPLGPILRGIHHWGAAAMVLAVVAHLATVFFAGSFKTPRELTWVLGVGLLLATLGLGFTGYLLPWDQKAYWATVVSANIPRDMPLVGTTLTRLVLGGDSVSGLTLTRFYAIHMLVLPALAALMMAAHIYLVRLHGVSERGPEPDGMPQTPQPESPPLYRFFPEHTARSLMVFAGVLALILALSVFARIPKEDIAGTVDESYLPRPEWYFMWLFQLLTYFPGSSEVIGSLVLPLVGVLLLFFLPLLDRSKFRGPADRPLATAAGVTGIVCIVYLTVTGFGGALPYGRYLRMPDRPLTFSEEMGMQAYVKHDCAYCHNIQGQGGRRVGPDLANIKAKGRTVAELVAFIKNPQSKSTWSIMPKYDLTEAELRALADFVLCLDFDRHNAKTITKEEILKGVVTK